MKKLATVLLAGLMLAGLSTAAHAGEFGEYAGTIPRVAMNSVKIDGEKDAVYNGAFRVMINQFNTGTENDTYGVANILWSEGSVYLYVEVYDNEVVSTTQDHLDNSPWTSDSVEIFFDFGNTHEQLVQQFRVDCDGYPSYFQEDGTGAYGQEKCAEYFNEYAARRTDYGYAIEMYINLDKYSLSLGGEIGLNLQVNDLTADSLATTNENYAVYNMASDVFNGSWAVDYYDYIVLGEELSYGDGSIDFKDLNFTELGEYDATSVGSYQMRAFCVDPTGRFVYGGTLQSSPPVLFQFSATTGEWLQDYSFEDDYGAYIKAVAADDRGYVYAGVANAANADQCFMSIVNSTEMSEVAYVTMDASGKLGCNGIGVVQMGDKYYVYYVTNYDTDRLYRIDVTDVQNPQIDYTFGTDGYIDLQTLGFADCGGVDGDVNGNIYLAGNKGNGSKGDTIVKMDFNGNVIQEIESAEPWSVEIYNDKYLITATRNGTESQVLIYNTEDLSLVKEYTPFPDAAGFSGAGIANGRLYFCDHGSGIDYIFVSDTIQGADTVTIAPSYIAEKEAAEAAAAEEAAKKAEEEAAAAAAAEAAASEPAAEETAAETPADTTETADTTAEATETTETAAAETSDTEPAAQSAESKGLSTGAIIGIVVGAVVVVGGAVGGIAVSKKKK